MLQFIKMSISEMHDERKNIRMALALPCILFSLIVQSTWADCNASMSLSKPNSIYQDHLNGTVTDTNTGLMWQKCSFGQSWNPGNDANDPSDDSCDSTGLQASSWHQALVVAQDANTGAEYGFADWRVPNVKELTSLLEPACYSPAINSNVFPNTVSGYYFSSSPYAHNASKSWAVSFYSGSVFDMSEMSSFEVRLVRTAQ